MNFEMGLFYRNADADVFETSIFFWSRLIMGSQTDRKKKSFQVALDSKLQSTEVLSAKQKSFNVIEISQLK